MSETAVKYAKPEDFASSQNNARFDLNQGRVDSLAESILSEGGVLQPIGVVQESGGLRPIYGFHRLAAVAKLNKDQGAGLLVPYTVLAREDTTAVLKTQIAENNERQEMSPMDRAVAMKNLLDQGVNRSEVRRIFAVPGGRKGTMRAPMSNSMLNIHLRFLELPKTVQEKLHSGTLTWAAAYELGRVTPDKRADVLKRAEEELARQMEREERDEAKYLDTERKLAEAEQTATTTATALELARAAIVEATNLHAARTEAYRQVQKEVGEAVTSKGATDKDKKVAGEKLKAAETDLKAAEKAIKDAKNEVAKLSDKVGTAKEKADEIRARLEAQRKALKNKPKAAVGPKAVKEAAVAEGAGGTVPLTLQDIRALITEASAQTEYPKVGNIFKYIRRALDGISTPKECVGNIAVLTGERQAPAPAKPAAEKKK